MSLTVVVSLPVPGSLETHLGTNLHCGADPMTPHDCVLRVSGRVARTLPFFVVEKISSKGEEVMRRQFLLQEIHHGILGSRAPLFAHEAVSSVRASFWMNVACDGRHVALI